MKSSTLICLCVIAAAAVIAAYLLGRESERVAVVRGDVNELKIQVSELRTAKLRSEVRWGWLARIGSQIPGVQWLLNKA